MVVWTLQIIIFKKMQWPDVASETTITLQQNTLLFKSFDVIFRTNTQNDI